VILAAAVWACGVSPEATPRAVDRADIRFDLAETSSSTTTTTTIPRTTLATIVPVSTVPLERAKLYMVRGSKLVPVERAIPPTADLPTIIGAIQAGPTDSEATAGLRTALPVGTVLGVQLKGGTATVDLAPSFLDLPPTPTEQQLAAGQLTMTLTDRGPGIGRVRFTVAGNPVPVPRGDGSAPQATDQSVSRDDYLSMVTGP
jgi:hypothetical protein